MIRLTAEQLEKARLDEIERQSEVLEQLRKSLHEYFLLEARGRKIRPESAVIALLEQAALSAAAAASMTRQPSTALAGYLGYFLAIVGKASDQPDIARIGNQIMEALNAAQRSERSN